MNPPSTVLGGVHGKVCWLIAYKYAPNTAINVDMGWPMPQQRQMICVIRHWCKLTT